MMLLAGGLFAAPEVRLGIGIGVPAPVAVVHPACPGPRYTWVDGNYAPNGVRVAGYWAPPAVVAIGAAKLTEDSEMLRGVVVKEPHATSVSEWTRLLIRGSHEESGDPCRGFQSTDEILKSLHRDLSVGA